MTTNYRRLARSFAISARRAECALMVRDTNLKFIGWVDRNGSFYNRNDDGDLVRLLRNLIGSLDDPNLRNRGSLIDAIKSARAG